MRANGYRSIPLTKYCVLFCMENAYLKHQILAETELCFADFNINQWELARLILIWDIFWNYQIHFHSNIQFNYNWKKSNSWKWSNALFRSLKPTFNPRVNISHTNHRIIWSSPPFFNQTKWHYVRFQYNWFIEYNSKYWVKYE